MITRLASHPVPDAVDRPRRRPVRRWFLRLLLTAGLLLGLALVILFHSTGCTAAFGGTAGGARLERMKASPQYANGRFHNLGAGLVQPVGSQWTTMREFFRDDPARRPARPLPVEPRETILRVLGTPPASGLRVTWLSHSTLLIEIDGRRFLTDPMFSTRASPSTVLGSRRFQPPALAIDELPPIDAVILSHDHYDHLDLNSVRTLNRRGVRFHAPLGVGAHLERWGVPAEHIVEYDWWDESQIGPVKLVATPAHHFSGRRVVDFNATLWASWVFVGSVHRVYFSGDSGLAVAHQTIGSQFGPFDLALLDIGAWHESWADVHFGPRGAAAAAKMLGARRLMPIHWGTFSLALHAWAEPVETLTTEAGARGIELLAPQLGQSVEPTLPFRSSAWWR